MHISHMFEMQQNTRFCVGGVTLYEVAWRLIETLLTMWVLRLKNCLIGWYNSDRCTESPWLVILSSIDVYSPRGLVTVHHFHHLEIEIWDRMTTSSSYQSLNPHQSQRLHANQRLTPQEEFLKEHVSEEKAHSKDLCWFVGSLVNLEDGLFQQKHGSITLKS